MKILRSVRQQQIPAVLLRAFTLRLYIIATKHFAITWLGHSNMFSVRAPTAD